MHMHVHCRIYTMEEGGPRQCIEGMCTCERVHMHMHRRIYHGGEARAVCRGYVHVYVHVHAYVSVHMCICIYHGGEARAVCRGYVHVYVHVHAYVSVHMCICIYHGGEARAVCRRGCAGWMRGDENPSKALCGGLHLQLQGVHLAFQSSTCTCKHMGGRCMRCFVVHAYRDAEATCICLHGHL